MEVDLARLADKARINVADEAQARGASLHTAEVEGTVLKLTPDGHVFAVELRGDASVYFKRVPTRFGRRDETRRRGRWSST
jgi:hypothetical protein